MKIKKRHKIILILSLFSKQKTKSFLMSVFYSVHAKFYLDVPVYKMKELKDASRILITRKLLTYDETIGGVILAIKNATPVNPYAKVYADTPAIHVQMEADFLIFKPDKGTILPAKVDHVAANSVNLTVLGVFTANIDMADLKNNWVFSRTLWRNGNESFGEGDSLQVEVSEITPSSSGFDFNVKFYKKIASEEAVEEQEAQAEE